MDRREPADEHGGLGEAEGATDESEERECRRRRPERLAPDMTAIPRQGEQTADHRAEANPLLALNDDEEEGGERDERQHRLAEAGVNVHEPVVGECERAADAERPVEHRAGQRSSARRRSPAGAP